MNQCVNRKEATAKIWERLGELKEIQEIEKVQRTKRTVQESAQPKAIGMTEECLSKFEEGILVLHEDANEEGKMGQNGYKEANWQADVEEQEMPTSIPSKEDTSREGEEENRKIDPIVEIREEDEENKKEDEKDLMGTSKEIS